MDEEQSDNSLDDAIAIFHAYVLNEIVQGERTLQKDRDEARNHLRRILDL